MAILQPLRQTAVFAPGAAAQPTGVAFYGILSDVESKCVRSGDAALVTLDTAIIGERGPAAGAASTGYEKSIHGSSGRLSQSPRNQFSLE